MNILIADDHEIVRQGLKRILEDLPFLDEVGEAENSARLLEVAATKKWDIVIVDINMPGRSGLDALHDLKRLFPAMPVLVLSMYPEQQFAVRVLRAGASGYVTKSSAAGELLDAIQKILRGGKYLSPSLEQHLLDSMQHASDAPPHEVLSNREYEVFRLIAQGKTVGEIAVELSLSVKTISTYRANILEKMKFKNNAAIVKYTVDEGLFK